MNTFNVIQAASLINQMNNEQLQLLAECILDGNGEKLSDYISMVVRDRDYMNIEVQESVC